MIVEKENKRANLLVNWLEKPYFFIEKTNTKLVVSFVVGFITFVYAHFFTPFKTEGIINDLLYISTGSAMVVIIVLFVYFFFINGLFPNFFNKKSWTIGRHILMLILIILTCGTTVYLYTQFTVPKHLITDYTYRDVIINSLKVSLIPIILQILLDNRMQKVNKAYYEFKINEQKNTLQTAKASKKESEKVKIYSYNKKDAVNFKIGKLVYITSEANYASFFIEEKGKLKELVLRRPLIQIEKELTNFTNIIRCHKSYIINTEYIKSYQGNAHGYRLNIKYSDLEIPVSRKFDKEDILKFVS